MIENSSSEEKIFSAISSVNFVQLGESTDENCKSGKSIHFPLSRLTEKFDPTIFPYNLTLKERLKIKMANQNHARTLLNVCYLLTLLYFHDNLNI